MSHAVLVCLCFAVAQALDARSIVFVVLSQENAHHVKLAENLRNEIHKQAEELNKKDIPVVHLTHSDFPHIGAWTILPLIPRLTALHKSNSSWIVFVEDRTHIELSQLLKTLNKYDDDEEIWLGYALRDGSPTIIHHFAFLDDPGKFKYPNVASGVAFTHKLFSALSDRLRRRDAGNTDFSIDSAHELALFVWDKGAGQTLCHEPTLCITPGPDCATYPTPFQPCTSMAPKDSIYFAVKTCRKFHEDRVPVVKRTWAQHAPRINFFSDSRDESIPTIALGIPNTESGHCGKTVGILQYAAEEIERDPEIRWLAIVDDDTILSVTRLQQLLSCYDPSTPVALGERYGYNLHNSRGYNYITGGGGMVFSRTLVERLVTPGVCDCPSLSSPDDMFLGICIARLGVAVTHSPLFHQARPADYAPEYLKTEGAVSFHKHWMIDPEKVYRDWFSEDDLKLARSYALYQRTEL